MMGLSMGDCYTLVFASVTKRALIGEMPAGMRLQFLNHLEKMTNSILTPAIIAMIDPIDDKGWELYLEAMKLGTDIVITDRVRQPDAFDVLHQKFEVFAALNPSLQRAYDAACEPFPGGRAHDSQD